MGRPGITAVDVVRAYVALLKQRRLPGPQNLRLELGTGSYSTIAQHVRRLALRHVALHPPRNSRLPNRRVHGWETRLDNGFDAVPARPFFGDSPAKAALSDIEAGSGRVR